MQSLKWVTSVQSERIFEMMAEEIESGFLPFFNIDKSVSEAKAATHETATGEAVVAEEEEPRDMHATHV